MFIRTLIIFISLCQFAYCHDLKPAIANLDLVSQNSKIDFNLKINLNLEAIIAGIEPNHNNTNQSDNSQKYNQLRNLSSKKLEEEFTKIKDSFQKKIFFFNNDKKIKFKKISINIPEVGQISLIRDTEINFYGNFGSKFNNLKFSWDTSYGPIILRVNKNKKEIITTYLKTDDIINFSTNIDKKQNFLTTIKDYIIIGFNHIVPKGLDHILFVVGLFLLSTNLKPLVWQVSAFTLAHTITIFLGVLNMINISASIVEPIIAISISYVAIENIFFKNLTKWRPIMVFVFGLLHGLGFAGILNEIGVSQIYFITSLISFNLGVELGQLFIIFICFMLMGFWFGKKAWYRSYLTTPLSFIIAIVGFIWFFQRIT